MNQKFTIEKWFEISFQILKRNWVEWAMISVVTSVILSAVFYFFVQEMGLLILQAVNEPEDYRKILVDVGMKLGIFLLAFLVVINFIDLFMIHTASQWYSGKRLTVEETVLKSLSAMPISIILNMAYIVMAVFASIFCILPVILVITFFLFTFQALIIEDKGFSSFGRSVELVKPNFGILIVLPFVIGIGLQMVNSTPIIFLQYFIESFMSQTISPDKTAKEIFEYVLKSPYLIIISAPSILFLSLQTNLKSIVYTIAFEQSREN
jgi:hypothetical protein